MDPETIELMKKYRAMVFQAIESLVDAEISRECTKEACSVLDVTSFSDVAEERSLAHICGYPPCSTALNDKKWQKYLIRGHKVYDTTERKRFCSDKCYECYLFVAKQLPEEPLWFRGPRPDGDHFRLLFLEDVGQKGNGQPGREIELVPSDLAESLSRVKLDDETTDNPPTDSALSAKAADRQRTEYAATMAAYMAKVERHFRGDESDKEEDDDKGEEPFHKHVDCEDSALGNWKSRRNLEVKSEEKIRPRRSIMIDPLPMPPSSKKSDT